MVVLVVCDKMFGKNQKLCDSADGLYLKEKTLENQKLYGSADGLWSERKVSRAEVSGE